MARRIGHLHPHLMSDDGMDEMSVRLDDGTDDGTDYGEAS